jgi:cell division protein FtsW
MVYSASATKADVEFDDPTKFLVRQILWAVAGVGIVFCTMRVDPKRLERFATPLLVLVIGLLVAVLVGGPLVNGARRWLRFGPRSGT